MKNKNDLIFTYSEVWGPFHCKVDNCNNEAWSILITEEEYEKYTEMDRYDAAINIYKNGDGIAICNYCLDKELS